MIRTGILAAALVMALAGTAFASSCPKHMKAIDDALAASPKITAAQMTEVKALRAEGETLHKAGKHAESEAALIKAEGILGIKK
jgi:hypothetical protein